MSDYLLRINWIDIIYVLLVFRVVYVALNRGLPVEIFKVIGILLGLYIAMHYYIVVSDFLQTEASQKDRESLRFVDSLCFVVLVVVGYGFLALIRFALGKYMKGEALSSISRWSGFALGVFRAFLLVGLISYGLLATGLPYFRQMVTGSLIASQTVRIAPNVYSAIWNGCGASFMPGEHYNSTVNEVLKGKNSS